MRAILMGAIALVTALSTGCNRSEEGAKARLQRAEELYANNALSAAKQQVDSIAILYPKEYMTIRHGQQLIRQIELTEQKRNLAFIDSVMPLRQAEAEKQKRNFYFEKDSLYQKLGDYVFKLQQLERNVQRCYLRAQTNEHGEMQLASVYYGSQPIEHQGVKVSLPDGTYAETVAVPYDGALNYRFEDNGGLTEVVTYKGGSDNGVVDFIIANGAERIKVSYFGKRPYIIYLDEQAKQSVAATYHLSQLLQECYRMELERARVEKRIAYLTQRIEQKAAELAAREAQ